MKTDIKILFVGAVRGGRINLPEYEGIVAVLEKYGTVLSKHIADKSVSQYGETDIEKEVIHDRELAALLESDLVVAEVTAPSLGVGYLIAEAVRLNKKVIALYRGEDALKLSAMIRGDKNVKIFLYKTLEDVDKIIAAEIN